MLAQAGFEAQWLCIVAFSRYIGSDIGDCFMTAGPIPCSAVWCDPYHSRTDERGEGRGERGEGESN